MDNNYVKEEDYKEPICPLSIPNTIEPIPINRVLEKLDYYLYRKDYPAAERHLEYWTADARLHGDVMGELAVINEKIGLFRKINQKDKCLNAAENALQLLNKSNSADITAATTYINVATAYKAFGVTDNARLYYEKAKPIYEEFLPENDNRLAGLYNNYALALIDSGDFDLAKELFFKALSIMKSTQNGEAQAAITYCNLADLVSAMYGTVEGEAQINEYLENAMELLNSSTLPQNGDYAFVCEKCAPTFGHYGYFMFEQELRERARKIYERD